MASPARPQPHTHEAAFDTGFLRVSSIHELYFEQYGKKDGKTVIVLHGGPGGASYPSNAQFFDPTVFRVIFFDQRGCGKSRPLGELRENQSMDLVADIESLRKHLGIAKWACVFGGSWGSTLAILYAQTHPDMVGSLILRGVWLMSQAEFDWTAGPVSWLFPEVYEISFDYLSPEEQKDPFAAYYNRLTCGDREKELEAARRYGFWAASIYILVSPVKSLADMEGGDEDAVLAEGRINAWYCKHRGWLREDQFLEPDNLEKIEHIPTWIVHGRYDVMCPPISAYRLHKGLKKSKLYMIPGAGHTTGEPGITDKLIEIGNELITTVV